MLNWKQCKYVNTSWHRFFLRLYLYFFDDRDWIYFLWSHTIFFNTGTHTGSCGNESEMFSINRWMQYRSIVTSHKYTSSLFSNQRQEEWRHQIDIQRLFIHDKCMKLIEKKLTLTWDVHDWYVSEVNAALNNVDVNAMSRRAILRRAKTIEAGIHLPLWWNTRAWLLCRRTKDHNFSESWSQTFRRSFMVLYLHKSCYILEVSEVWF